MGALREPDPQIGAPNREVDVTSDLPDEFETGSLFDGEISQPLRELLNDEFLSDPISGDWILDDLGERNPNPMPIEFHTGGDFPSL